MKQDKYRLNAILMLAYFALFMPRAEGTEYTWTNNNAVWSSGGNWSPSGGPPTTGDTGLITNLTCIANTNLPGGPIIRCGPTPRSIAATARARRSAGIRSNSTAGGGF